MARQTITPCLRFDGSAEEAASLRLDLSGLGRHGGDARVETGGCWSSFRLAGQEFIGLNGGPMFKFNEAISLH